MIIFVWLVNLFASLILNSYSFQLFPLGVNLTVDLVAIQRSFTKIICNEASQRSSATARPPGEAERDKILLPRAKVGDIYAVIFIWKILEGTVSNFSIESFTNTRTGRHCTVSMIPAMPSRFRASYCNSLSFRSSHLFNILPKSLRVLHKVV